MLVVITLASVMVGLAATTIHLLLGAEREAQRAVRFNRSVMRLSEAFRADVRAAGRVEIPVADSEKSVLLLGDAEGGREVRYEIDGHQATRVESDKGEQTHHDSYYFPPRSRIRFDRQADRKLLQLEIEMPAGNSSDNAEIRANVPEKFLRKLKIEALPGRDHRFENPTKP
jgi:hypothetical protein